MNLKPGVKKVYAMVIHLSKEAHQKLAQLISNEILTNER